MKTNFGVAFEIHFQNGIIKNQSQNKPTDVILKGNG